MRFSIAFVTLELLVVSGCSQSHGADDGGGGGLDAPGCSPRPTSYLEIECPAPPAGATTASVSITTSPTVCCSSGSVTPSVSRTGDAFTVDLAWNACDCCEACRCVGPIETATVPLDGLEPGHSYAVSAGTSSCSFTVPAAGDCRVTGVGDVRMPRVVFAGDPIPATLQSVMLPGSCSCTPSLSPASPDELGILACECCDECDCVDYLYEVSGEIAAPPPGDHTVAIVSGTPASRPLAVRDASACRPAVDPLTLDVVGPSPEATTSGPRWWWLHVQGAELVCCAEPLPALRALEGEPGAEYVFELLTCTADPCDCVPKEPTRWETWVPIGEPSPGSYMVRVGGVSVGFSVPLGP